MAFPTTSLTNNQVHKEGNRAFVYDSALGTWDQLRETDRTENKILSGEIGGAVQGEIGNGVTFRGSLSASTSFPAGHIIKTYSKQFRNRQAFTNNDPANDSSYITVGHGASGTNGDPLIVTTDTPASSASKYLITAVVYQSRSQDGMLCFRVMYSNNGVHTSIILGRSASSQTRATFGRGHPSTLGNSGNYGLAHSGITFLWEPNSAFSQTIYVKGSNYTTTANHVNCDDSDANTSHVINTISTLTVQEIAG